jgi:hypothetical protein
LFNLSNNKELGEKLFFLHNNNYQTINKLF